VEWQNIVVEDELVLPKKLVGATCLMRTQQYEDIHPFGGLCYEQKTSHMNESAPWVVNCDERDPYNFWPPLW